MADTRSDVIRPARQRIPAVLPVRCANEIRLVPLSDIWFRTWSHDTTLVVTGAGEFKISGLRCAGGAAETIRILSAHCGYIVNLHLEGNSSGPWRSYPQ